MHISYKQFPGTVWHCKAFCGGQRSTEEIAIRVQGQDGATQGDLFQEPSPRHDVPPPSHQVEHQLPPG